MPPRNPIFGLTSGSRGGGRGRGGRGGGGGGSNTRFTGNRGGGSFRGRGGAGGGGGRGGKAADPNSAPERADDGSASEERFEEVRVRDEIDEKLGFWRWEGGATGGEKDEREGWLVNMHQVGPEDARLLARCLRVRRREGGARGEDREGEEERRTRARAHQANPFFLAFVMADADEGRLDTRREGRHRPLFYPGRWGHVQDDHPVRALLLCRVQGERKEVASNESV